MFSSSIPLCVAIVALRAPQQTNPFLVFFVLFMFCFDLFFCLFFCVFVWCLIDFEEKEKEPAKKRQGKTQTKSLFSQCFLAPFGGRCFRKSSRTETNKKPFSKILLCFLGVSFLFMFSFFFSLLYFFLCFPFLPFFSFFCFKEKETEKKNN